MKIRLAIAAAMLGLTASQATSAQVSFKSGTWENELGSTMTITTVDPNSGQLSGYYVTAVAAPGCSAVGIQQPLTGWYSVTSSAITFAVNWLAPGCNSVASWSGRYNASTQKIDTIWTLTGKAGWSDMNIGTDTFWAQGTGPKSLKKTKNKTKP